METVMGTDVPHSTQALTGSHKSLLPKDSTIKGSTGHSIQTVLELKAAAASDVQVQSPLAAFYAIPAVRFLIRGLVHLTVTGLYLLLIFYCFERPNILDARKMDPRLLLPTSA